MRTLIIEDHLLVSSGFRLLLAEFTPIENIVECANGVAAMIKIRESNFELVLLDWNLGHAEGPAGAPLIREIKAAQPAARVVIVSGDTRPETVHAAIEAGAAGYIFKDTDPAHLVDVLRILQRGGTYLPELALADRDGRRDRAETESGFGARRGELREIGIVFPRLTPRHVDVLNCLVRGMSNKEIARQLDITDGTVKQHLMAIFRELGVDNRTEAVYLLAKSGVRFP
ncbi:MAG: response regulator transcription factor [Burkholderiales bacterium]|nr:response regulator transcription factor [Burkholderiales bacterium]MDE2457507.1 response regulator transcription factor [Burkholderiales bacterium]